MASDFTFPFDLTGYGIPLVRLKCEDKKDPMSVYFPCPSNLTYNNTGAYGTEDYGTGADSLGNLVSKARSLAGKGAELTGSENLAKLAQAAKITFNPKTNTSFSSNGIRAFSFAFKVIPNSPEESKKIKEFIQYTEKMVYAETFSPGGLKYPPKWRVQFLIDDGGYKVNEFIPRIYESYLTAFQPIYNATFASFYEDGAPQSVDLQMSFQEAKALTRTEIINMQSGKDDPSISEVPNDILKQKAAKLSSGSGPAGAGGSGFNLNSIFNKVLNSSIDKGVSKLKSKIGL